MIEFIVSGAGLLLMVYFVLKMEQKGPTGKSYTTLGLFFKNFVLAAISLLGSFLLSVLLIATGAP